jgi:hypothetical protein
MITKHGRTVLGSLLGILIICFALQGLMYAQGIEETGRNAAGVVPAEFSLVAAAATAASAGPADPAAFAAPTPQFIPPISSPALGGGEGFGDTAFKASLAAAFALNLGDYFLTKACLKYSGTAEGNPMMKGIVKNPYVFAAVKIGVSAVSVFLLDRIYKKNKVLGWLMSAAINSAMSYVVLHNYSVLRQVQAGSTL